MIQKIFYKLNYVNGSLRLACFIVSRILPVIVSGSLKEIAKQYGVTYPTVRLRLDKVIQKIQIGEDAASEPYIALIKRFAVNEKVDFDTAKILISEYKKVKYNLQYLHIMLYLLS